MSTIKLNNQSFNTQKTATKTVPTNSGSDAPARERSSPSNNRHSNEGVASARAGKRGGPKTRHGKERSSRNSLRHGIFSTVVLLEDEPAAEFDFMLQGFRNDFHPEGVVEEKHTSSCLSRCTGVIGGCSLPRERKFKSKGGTIHRPISEISEIGKKLRSSSLLWKHELLRTMKNGSRCLSPVSCHV